MNYLSKNTEKIIEIIDDINDINNGLNYEYFNNINIKPYYDHIYNLYKKIEYNLTSKKIENIQTTDFCGAFDLLEYLLNNNLINNFKNLGINEDGNSTLDYIIKNKLKNKCKIWINLNGKQLLRSLYILKETKKIPDNLINKLSVIDEDLMSEFTPFDVIEYLGSSKLIKYTLTLEYLNTNVKLKIVTKQPIKNSMLERIIKNIFLMVSIKKQKTNIDDFTIVLIMTLFKKTFPKEYKILGPREINSGLCIFNTRKIIIFRKEEFEKLLIHELCHLLDLDLSVVNIQNINQYVNINPDFELRINESITEILALIIHSILVSINLSKKKNYKLATTLLNYEINFNLIQIAKILNHFDFKNSQSFFKKYDGENKFKQTTSVLSYFIIKTACLFNKEELNKFLNNNFIIFNYKNKQVAIDEYKTLVINSLNNTDFHNIINKLMNNIVTKNKMFLETLKMTCIEMN
jgi:hypothetical protein